MASIFRGLFRALTPAAKIGFSAAKKVARSSQAKKLARSVGRSMKDSALDFAGEVLSGENAKTAAKRNISNAKKDISKSLKAAVLRQRSGNKTSRKRAKPPRRAKARSRGRRSRRAPVKRGNAKYSLLN